MPSNEGERLKNVSLHYQKSVKKFKTLLNFFSTNGVGIQGQLRFVSDQANYEGNWTTPNRTTRLKMIKTMTFFETSHETLNRSDWISTTLWLMISLGEPNKKKWLHQLLLDKQMSVTTYKCWDQIWFGSS